MKSKKLTREEFEAKFVKCPKCGYRNKKVFVENYGTCNCCDKVLDGKARLRYELKVRNNHYKRRKERW